MSNNTSKPDAYQLVTDSILAMIEKGTLPWRKTWAGSTGTTEPLSMSSGKPYSGINPFLLTCTAIEKGYSSRHWGTFKAIKAQGGSVRKGEKSTAVVFWKWIKKEDEKTGTEKVIPFLRHFRVFNAEQAEWPEGLPEAFQPLPAEDQGDEFDPVEAAEAIVQGYVEGHLPPSLTHDGGARAFYRPATDAVAMPKREAFEGPGEYYSTLFHELGHSTGAASRLNRKGITDFDSFGSHQYSQEELVAEFTACFLCSDAGIEDTRPNSAAYIAGWASKLKGDKKLVVMAAAQAVKAARMIRNGGKKDEARQDA
jgi:antirestriction protein ArdC